MDTLAFDATPEPVATRNGFNRFWPMMAPPDLLADDALRDTLWKEVEEGRTWLFLSAEAAILVCIETRAGGMRDDVRVCLFGGRANALNDLMPEIEVFARSRGCAGIVLQVDPKAKRHFRDFDPVVLTLRRGLD